LNEFLFFRGVLVLFLARNLVLHLYEPLEAGHTLLHGHSNLDGGLVIWDGRGLLADAVEGRPV